MATATQRDPKNISPVIDGQVLVSFEEDPRIGEDGFFNEAWETVGILNDGSQISIQKAIEKNKTNGWGFGVVAVSTKPGELTASCEVLEDNPTVQKIAWPTAAESVLYHDGKVARCHVAFVEAREDGSMRIRATRHKAYASMEQLGYGEQVEGKQIDFDIMPGPAKDVFDELVLDSVEVTPATVDRIRFNALANEPAPAGG